jgi:hypothetical protein
VCISEIANRVLILCGKRPVLRSLVDIVVVVVVVVGTDDGFGRFMGSFCSLVVGVRRRVVRVRGRVDLNQFILEFLCC